MKSSEFLSLRSFRLADINGLPTPTVFSISLYKLVFLVLLGAGVYLLLRKDSSFKLLARILTGVWLFLGLVVLLSQLVQVKAEYRVFSGKSLAELRELTTSGGYYSFLQFAQEKIPPKSPVVVILPRGSDYFWQKTEYYLYPHPVVGDAEYFLIFESDHARYDSENQRLTYFTELGRGAEKIVEGVEVLAVYTPTQFILMVD